LEFRAVLFRSIPGIVIAWARRVRKVASSVRPHPDPPPQAGGGGRTDASPFFLPAGGGGSRTEASPFSLPPQVEEGAERMRRLSPSPASGGGPGWGQPKSCPLTAPPAWNGAAIPRAPPASLR